MLTAITIACVGTSVAWGQSHRNAAANQVPRTAWGDPDLQGTYTNDNEFGIPFERPERFAARAESELSPQELADYLQEQRTQRRPPDPDDPFLEFTDPQNSRAWLLSDPPDGKFPAQTAEAIRRRGTRQEAARRQAPRGEADSYTDRSQAERCLGGLLPFPMRPGREGNVYQIIQGPGVVAIRYERLDITRVIVLDGRPHVARELNTYLGDARGHWEGNALVIDTLYSDKAYEGYPGITSGTLRTTERFTPTESGALEFQITYVDSAAWVSPFTWGLRLTPAPSKQVLEYACHEGNYGLRNILSAARAAERAAKK